MKQFLIFSKQGSWHMRKSYLIGVGLLVLAGCQTLDTNPYKPGYKDLTAERDERGSYWKAKKMVTPSYPREAVRLSKNGCVQMVVSINAEGKVDGYQIKNSYPEDMFVGSMVNVIGKWDWAPAAHNTEKMPAVQDLYFEFKMEREGKEAKNVAEAKAACEKIVLS
ncbi:energy transducer TonB [Shewanella litorisediminis]|uniref:Energy transducer TonB n=1 Tax=Shewanella litorisediminis TaxID=1173586 RepID=A0ABX7G1K6_9GAMM|nr:energy transducer TonB [Shewanella litorisediminis]MCL2919054.1 energy transducer TonB [Shewanella litorisediminis]QRH01117.1 energy transducer TonB [Shewanella litorisediminis]